MVTETVNSPWASLIGRAYECRHGGRIMVECVSERRPGTHVVVVYYDTQNVRNNNLFEIEGHLVRKELDSR